jgi:hypothetical protein
MANRSKVLRAKRSIRVTVTVSPAASSFEQLQQLAPVSPRAAGFLPVDLAAPFRAKLLKLRVERLAVGADAGVSEVAVLRVCSGHIFR